MNNKWKECQSIKLQEMGPSMSNPNRFTQRNRKRRLQAYERKHRAQISLDSKINIKTISQLPSNKHQEIYEQQTFMIKEQKKKEDEQILPNAKKKDSENVQELKELLETPEKVGQDQQNYIESHKTCKNEDQKNKIKAAKPEKSQLVNSQSKKSSARRIILNDQRYEIDRQKMKSRRLRSKERYSKIIFQKERRSKLSPFYPKQSFTTNSIPNGVSTLELHSQLHPTTEQTIISRHEYYELRNQSTQINDGKVSKNRGLEQTQQEKVRAEYFDEYVGSFESKYSREYQEKVKKCVSDKKLLKAKKISRTEKEIAKIQDPCPLSEYEIKSEKRIPSKKSENTASSIQTQSKSEKVLGDLQQNIKQPLKLIKVHKNKAQPCFARINNE